MMNLAEVTAELVTVLEDAGFVAYGPTDNPGVSSCHVGWPTNIVHDYTAGGWSTFELPVLVLVSSASTPDAHLKLSDMISGQPGSVIAALKSATHGTSYRGMMVVNTDAFGEYKLTQGSAIGCSINLQLKG